MKKHSAGILVYKKQANSLEVLLVHPGGPFWTKKDVWGIPKGENDETEDPLVAAKREFEEELNHPAPDGDYLDLGEIKISSGKIIKAWAVEADVDVAKIKSNVIKIEWPPRSGQQIEIPEVDKAEWLLASQAITKMHKGQEAFIERLAEKLDIPLAATPKPEQGSLF